MVTAIVQGSVPSPFPPPPGNKRVRAKAATVARLKTAARFLFTNVGYFDVGIRDVAQRMGMSTGAVFANVADKAALWRLAMNGPAPSERLAEEVALLQALRPGWSWVLRFNGQEHLAGLTPPDFRPNALQPNRAHSGRGATPAEALRQARLEAERHDADLGSGVHPWMTDDERARALAR